MRIPKPIKDFINSTNQNTGLYFVEMLDEMRGQPVVRTFAYKNTKTYGIECEEVFREFLDHNEMNDALYLTSIAGYQVKFKTRKIGYGYTPTHKFYKTNDKFWSPNYCVSRVYTIREAVALFSKYVKYFVLPTETGVYSIIEYARVYKEQPRLELLAKAGFPYFYKDKRMFKMNDAKMKLFANWIKNNKSFIYRYTPNWLFINGAVKHNETGEQHRYRVRAEQDQKYLKHYGIERTYEQMVVLEKYLERQGCDIDIYKDYINARKTLKLALNSESVLMPRKLMEQHDCLINRIDAKKNAKKDKKLLTIYNRLNKLTVKNKNLKIVVPKNVAEFVKWGNALHNCVGSLGYDKKMIKGNCIIVGVFLNNKIIECCELNKQHQIEQLRGDHNGESEYHKECLALVNKFRRKLKYANC